MKTRAILILLTAFLSTAAASAQGQVNFITVLGPSGARSVDAPVFLPDGSPPGIGFTAQLFLVDDGVYTGLFPTTTFRTDVPAAAYYVVDPGIPVTVPGFAPGESAPLVMRVWQTEAGSYEASAIYGETPIADILLGGGTLPPTNLEGLQGIGALVPEPTVLALGLIGLAFLLIQRASRPDQGGRDLSA